MPRLSTGYTLTIPALVLLHLVVAPYTKVEESFNIQAVHDILQHGVPVTNAALKFKALFDHMTFSGSVPRTFVGALALAGLSKPLIMLNGLSGLAAQITVRNILGLLNAAALVTFINSIRKAYGNRTAIWYTIFQASQFHVFFYASRTLPNMFAFCLSTFASASFLPGPTDWPGDRIARHRRAFYLLTFAGVIFRSELALLVASHAAYEIIKSGGINNAYSLVRRVIFPAVSIAGVVSTLISVSVDTYFWQSDYLLLPELAAFWFNIFPKDHQGASAWGTSPWHWYFTSALPRLILAPSLLLIPYGLLFTTQRKPTLDATIPPFLYIAIYSILPHKETRFIFPIIPSLTLATAIPASYLNLRRDQTSRLLIALLALSATFTAFLSHAILLPLSAQSYPGGTALQALHSYHYSNNATATPQSPLIHVHLTNLALQTGITRFLEQPLQRKTTLWVYDKSPTINGTDATGTSTFLSQFDYIVIEPSHLSYLDGLPRHWTKVASASSLRRARPRIISPDSERGCLVLNCERGRRSEAGGDGLYDLFRTVYGGYVAWGYAALHDILREGHLVSRSLTKGYWIDWGLEERLVVLQQG